MAVGEGGRWVEWDIFGCREGGEREDSLVDRSKKGGGTSLGNLGQILTLLLASLAL